MQYMMAHKKRPERYTIITAHRRCAE